MAYKQTTRSTPGYTCQQNHLICYRSTYRYPHDVAFCVLRTSNKDAAQQNTNSAEQGSYSESKLCPATNVDKDLRILVHGFRIRVPIWQDQIAVGMLVEVDERTLLLLLRRWRRHATRHRNSSGIELRLGRVGIDHRVPLISIGLPAARHGCKGARIEGDEGR